MVILLGCRYHVWKDQSRASGHEVACPIFQPRIHLRLRLVAGGIGGPFLRGFGAIFLHHKSTGYISLVPSQFGVDGFCDDNVFLAVSATH